MAERERLGKASAQSLNVINEFYLGGVQVTATAAQLNAAGSNEVANGVVGIASGYKIARGVSSITGTGVVASGLTTIVSVVAVLKDNPSLNATLVSATFSGANITLNVWAPTSSSNCTPVASSTATNIEWIAIGT